MKVLRKMTVLLMTGALTAGLLSGCAVTGGNKDGLVYKTSGITPETTMLTVDGIKVSAEEYFYWLAYSCDYMKAYSESGEIDWNAVQEDESTTAEYVKDDTLQTAKLYAIVESKAKEYDCGLTSENQTDLDSMRKNFVSQFGSEEEYLQQLANSGLTDETFMKLNSVTYMYQNLKANLYAEGGALYPTDEQLTKFATDKGYMHANHILFSTKDDDGNDLSAAEKAKVLAKAKEILAQLRASSDPLTLFNTLAKENTDDTGYASNPDGYYFAPGEMTEDFESAVSKLNVNEISDIVETEYGYHIILRLPVDNSKLASQYADDAFDTQIDQWQKEAKVTFSKAYDSVNPQDFYTKLTKERDEIQAAAEAAESEGAETGDAEQASPSPSAGASVSPTVSAAG